MADSFNELFGLGGHPANADLVGWWPLQETSGTTAADLSATGNDGAVSGMGSDVATRAGPTAWLPSAFDFDGSDDYVDISGPALPKTGNFAVLAWINNTGLSSDGDSPWFKRGTTNGYGLYIRSGAACIIKYGVANIQPGFPITPNTWYHTAVTYDGIDTVLWYNGVYMTYHDAGYVAADNTAYIGHNDTGGEAGHFRGGIAEVAVFNAALDADDQAEVIAGPEPLNTVAPVASGTAAVGEELSCTPGTWNSQGNGTVAYSYQWTRSGDDSGTGEADISGATSSTYTVASADAGKYLRCRVRGSNDGGYDEDADTASNWIAIEARSFNALFGLGSHAEDAALVGWWPLQETSGRDVFDLSSHGDDGTWEGVGTITSGTGPGKGFPAAIRFTGTGTNYISLPLGALGNNDATFLIRAKVDDDPPAVATGFCRLGDGDGNTSRYPLTTGVITCAIWRGVGPSQNNQVNVGDPTPSLTSWHDVMVRTQAGGDWVFALDDAVLATTPALDSPYTSSSWYLGRSGSQNMEGYLADAAIFSRAITDNEHAQWRAGPEPLNSVAPAATGTTHIDEDVSCAPGTWNSQDNGSLSYSYQWTRSDDDSGTGEVNISGATSSTYTIQEGDTGAYLRCWVRATNDGGYDEDADTASNFLGPVAMSHTGTAESVSHGQTSAEPLLTVDTGGTADAVRQRHTVAEAAGNTGVQGLAAEIRHGHTTADGEGKIAFLGPAESLGHAQTLDAPSLSQGHALTVADLRQPGSAGEPILSQHHPLSAAAVRQGWAAGEAVLRQDHRATADPVPQRQQMPDAAGNVGVQGPIDGLAARQILEEPDLSQTHQLAAESLAEGQTAGQPDLSQVHQLHAEEPHQKQSIQSPEIHRYTGAADGVRQRQAAAAGAFSQGHQLAADVCRQLQATDTPILRQNHGFDAESCRQRQTAAEPLGSTGSAGAADACRQRQGCGSPALSQSHQLTTSAVLHRQTIAPARLRQQHLLTAAALRQRHLVGTPEGATRAKQLAVRALGVYVGGAVEQGSYVGGGVAKDVYQGFRTSQGERE